MVKQRRERQTVLRSPFLVFFHGALVQLPSYHQAHCCLFLTPSRWRKTEVRASGLRCRKAEMQSIGRPAQTARSSSSLTGNPHHFCRLEYAPSLFHLGSRPEYWTMARHFSRHI